MKVATVNKSNLKGDDLCLLASRQGPQINACTKKMLGTKCHILHGFHAWISSLSHFLFHLLFLKTQVELSLFQCPGNTETRRNPSDFFRLNKRKEKWKIAQQSNVEHSLWIFITRIENGLINFFPWKGGIISYFIFFFLVIFGLN